MDIIIEGILTSDEGMNDLLETIIHLKTVNNALLRISSTDGQIKGRIGFGPGGHILGGCIDDTGELGYVAVKKLLSIHSGNYAVLDTGREHPPEVNQTLWLKGERILETWPQLPETSDSLLDIKSNALSALQAPPADKTRKVERGKSITRVRFKALNVARKNSHGKRNFAMLLAIVIVLLLLILFVITSSDKLLSPAQKILFDR